MAVSFYFTRLCFFELFLFGFPSRDLKCISSEKKKPKNSLPEVAMWCGEDEDACFSYLVIPVDDLGVFPLGLQDQMLSHPAMLNLRTDLDPLNFQVMLWESIRQGPMPPPWFD